MLLWGGIIIAIYLAYRFARAPAVLSFWLAYILTRPLGASIGDLLSQPRDEKGLGLGTLITSLVFLGLILITALFLAFSRVDVATETVSEKSANESAPPPGRGVDDVEMGHGYGRSGAPMHGGQLQTGPPPQRGTVAAPAHIR